MKKIFVIERKRDTEEEDRKRGALERNERE
jgi:hypothetical protein